MPRKILTSKFFNRSTPEVAKELIGTYLVRRINGATQSHMITETEAYDGPDDKACHGRFGRTKRTEIMFGPAGYWYTYFVYGTHWMLNIVTGEENYPAAVLIRGIEGNEGPGRLTKALRIDKSFNALPATRNSHLWIEYRGEPAKKLVIFQKPRIGIDYAGPVWANKQYRFVAKSRKI